VAKGKTCPECGHHMFAVKEEGQAYGTWVWYQCRNQKCGFEEKVYEENER
jgi:hypothetical protein